MCEYTGSNPVLCSMKQTIRKREYNCKCGAVLDCYVWESDLKTHNFECEVCGELLSYDNLVKKEVVQTAAIRTPTKNR